jgi:hypothetical protein
LTWVAQSSKLHFLFSFKAWHTPYLLLVAVYSREREERKKERKKEKNSKAQALACLMSIVLSFVFALCY